jgi:hypothetical protein
MHGVHGSCGCFFCFVFCVLCVLRLTHSMAHILILAPGRAGMPERPAFFARLSHGESTRCTYVLARSTRSHLSRDSRGSSPSGVRKTKRTGPSGQRRTWDPEARRGRMSQEQNPTLTVREPTRLAYYGTAHTTYTSFGSLLSACCCCRNIFWLPFGSSK